MNRSSRRHATSFLKKSCLSILVAFALSSANAAAQAPDATVQYAISAGDLIQVVNEISRNSGVQIAYDIELLRGLKSRKVSGSMTLEQALNRALGGSGLGWTRVNATTVTIQKSPSTTPKWKEDKPTSRSVPVTDDEARVAELEKLVVVGSRLSGAEALPVIVIGREDIERSGASSIAQVLSQRPEVSINNNGNTTVADGIGNTGSDFRTNATTVQLRGLPQGTTLVLVNGRRVGGSAGLNNGVFDLSTLPLAMVDRIEILPFGASAIYGGDGLGGVVNIVLKQNASGLDIRAGYSFADGYDVTEAGFTWGKAWSRGSLTVGGSYSDKNSLNLSERSLTADGDYRRFGGYDLRGGVGNVYSLDGCPAAPQLCFAVPIEQRGNLPGLNAPVAGIPAGQDGLNLSTEDFVATAGIRNLYTRDRAIFSAAKQYGVSIDMRYQVAPRMEMFSGLTYTKRKLPTRELSINASSGQYGLSVLPADNPYNPFGVDVGVDFTYEDTGVFVDFENTYLNAYLGARGEWGHGAQSWDWELTGWLSKDRSKLSPNLQIFPAPDVINAALALSDPATALNPFRTIGGPFAPPDVIRAFFLPENGGGRFADFGNALWGVNGYVKGPLFQVPAGQVAGLLGAEYQREKLDFQINITSGAEDADGVSDVRAIFGELRVPLLAKGNDSNQRELLSLTGALRTDENSRFKGRSNTKTIGLEFRPLRSLLLRASYSDAYKPLPLYGAAQDPIGYLTPISDPQMGGQQYAVAETLVSGGIPSGLKPETSATRSLGLVYAPDNGLGLRLTATAWDSRLQDRIISPESAAESVTTGPQFMVDNESLFPDRVTRDPQSGIITSIDARVINIALTRISGIDVGMGGSYSTSIGEFEPSLAATYMYQYDEKLSPNSPLRSNLAVRQSTGWAPRWKIVPRIGWSYQDIVYASLAGRYVSAYRDPLALSTGPEAGTFQTLGDVWHFDLHFSVDVGHWLLPESAALSGARFSLSVTNLLDRLPDYCNKCFGYDATQYDILGRYVSAQIRINY